MEIKRSHNLLYVPIMIQGREENNTLLEKFRRPIYDIMVGEDTIIGFHQVFDESSPHTDISSTPGCIVTDFNVYNRHHDALSGYYNKQTNISAYHNHRLDKLAQGALLNNHYFQRELNLFRRVRGWNGCVTADASRDTAKRLINKPLDGARGLGISLVPPGKSAEWFHAQKLAASKEVFGCGEKYREALAKVDITISECYESQQDESAKRFAESNAYFEVIENVETEIRIITGADGSPGLAVVRPLEMSKSGIMQTGAPSGESMEAIYFHEMDIPSAISKEIAAFIKELNMPLTAFDIFITTGEEDGVKEWGIFEFSPEAGTQSIPTSWIQDECDTFYSKALYDHVMNYLKFNDPGKYKAIQGEGNDA